MKADSNIKWTDEKDYQILLMREGEMYDGDTLIEAIRNAGITCETCEHYRASRIPHFGSCKIANGMGGEHGDVEADDFCREHTKFDEAI